MGRLLLFALLAPSGAQASHIWSCDYVQAFSLSGMTLTLEIQTYKDPPGTGNLCSTQGCIAGGCGACQHSSGPWIEVDWGDGTIDQITSGAICCGGYCERYYPTHTYSTCCWFNVTANTNPLNEPFLCIPATSSLCFAFVAIASVTGTPTMTSTRTDSGTITETKTISPTATVSGTNTAVALPTGATGVAVFPNPSAGDVASAVVWVPERSRVVLEVWNAAFQPMLTTTVTGGPDYVSIPFDVRTWGSGVYLVRATSTGQTTSRRIRHGPNKLAILR